MESVKRAWVSPVAGMQKFVAQDYCASCGIYTVRKHGRTHRFWLDLDGDTIVDSGEEFDANGYNGNNSGNFYPGINVYRYSSSNREYESTPCDNDSFTIKNGYAYNVS